MLKKVLALLEVPKWVPKIVFSPKKCPKKHFKEHFWQFGIYMLSPYCHVAMAPEEGNIVCTFPNSRARGEPNDTENKNFPKMWNAV